MRAHWRCVCQRWLVTTDPRTAAIGMTSLKRCSNAASLSTNAMTTLMAHSLNSRNQIWEMEPNAIQKFLFHFTIFKNCAQVEMSGSLAKTSSLLRSLSLWLSQSSRAHLQEHYSKRTLHKRVNAKWWLKQETTASSENAFPWWLHRNIRLQTKRTFHCLSFCTACCSGPVALSALFG